MFETMNFCPKIFIDCSLNRKGKFLGMKITTEFKFAKNWNSFAIIIIWIQKINFLFPPSLKKPLMVSGLMTFTRGS